MAKVLEVNNDGSQLKLFLWMMQPDCLLGTSILVHVALQNVTDQPVTANCRFRFIPGRQLDRFQDLIFHVFNLTTGKHAPYKARMSLKAAVEPSHHDYRSLLPGYKYTERINLSSDFFFKEQGVYQVSVKYHNVWDGIEFGLNVWQGELTSNEIRMTLIPPEVV